MCHLMDYDNGKRKEQIQSLNFRWSAVAGAGFANVSGSVAKGETPEVSYNPALFDENGKVALPMVREVQNKNCLFCHRESDLKKAGASFRARTDVHIRAGLRCMGCHKAAPNSSDPEIGGRETHEFAKGDNPEGFGRKDLDNSMKTCRDCHLTGEMNAPIIEHRGLPPSHFEKIACQTCHIPQRHVKSIIVQDSTVFNPGARIPDSKRMWSFYGPDIGPWNSTGEYATYPEELFPLFSFHPTIGRYKGKLYPMNRAYTIWMGIETEGKGWLNQVFTKELVSMWKQHAAEPDTVFPRLKEIRDDNGDGFPEVNRLEEIQALIAEVTEMLNKRKRLSANEKVVFVDGSLYTSDGMTWRSFPDQEPHEISPYGSVFKLSHDITPARNALGAGGCNDCHGSDSNFFFRDAMLKPFNREGKPIYQKNADLMGYSPLALRFMIFHHRVLKPLTFWFAIGIGIVAMFLYIVRLPSLRSNPVRRFTTVERTIYFSALFLFGIQILIGLANFSAIPFTSDTIGKINIAHRYLGYLLFFNFLAVFVVWTKEKNGDIIHKTISAAFLLAIIPIPIVCIMLGNEDTNFGLIANGLMHDAAFIASIVLTAGIFRIWKKRPEFIHS